MRRYALMLLVAIVLATAAVAWAVAPTGIPVAPSPAPTAAGLASPSARAASPIPAAPIATPAPAPPAPTATATPIPTAPIQTRTPATPTPDPTDPPGSHTALDLEAVLPSSVSGIALDRTSPSIAGQLEADPRAANALRLLRLTGRSASDIRFAQAEDLTNPARLTVLAFQIRGIPASVYGRTIVNAVVSELSGTQTTTITLAGRRVTRATPPAGGSSAYIYEAGDVAFAIQTTDESLAAAAIAQLP